MGVQSDPIISTRARVDHVASGICYMLNIFVRARVIALSPPSSVAVQLAMDPISVFRVK